MKKIAILNCLQTNGRCMAGGCFNAFNTKDKTFARYKDEDIQLISLGRCSQCHVHLADEENMKHKLEVLVEKNVDVVHIGSCASKKDENENRYLCPFMKENAVWLKEHGVEIVWGTHNDLDGIPGTEWE